VWVSAVNNAGRSYSDVESGKPKNPTSAPASPKSPWLSPGSREITVWWQAVEGTSAYEVWFGTSDNSAQAQKYGSDITGGSTETVITGLENNTTYYVWIKAKNPLGTSGFSPSANAKPSAFYAIPLTPETPSVSLGDGQVTVTWTETEGALAYEVWMRDYYSYWESGTKIGEDISGEFYATKDGLTNGTTYYFWVKAKNDVGISESSSAVSGRPIANATKPTLSAGNEQLSVTWTTIVGAEQYEVFCGTDVNPPQSATQTVYGTSATISGLVNGTMYNVWVRGKNATGSGVSGVASAKPIGNMGTVTVSLGGSGELVLNWATVAGADQYDVFYNTSNSIPTNPSQTVSTNTATISGLTNGTTYYVWVKGKNANGTGNANTSGSGKPMVAPGSLTISSGNEQITVSWAAVTGATSYEVYYSTATTIPDSSAFTVTGLNRTITSLINGTTYNFWVKAINTNGTSGASPMASGKPIGNMGTVTASPSESGELVLNWATVNGADQYDVYYNTSNSIPTNPSQTVLTNTATISSLTNGATYYAWVKPKNANGTGAVSTAVSGKPMGNVGAVTLTTGGSGELILNWSTVTGADQYEVYYRTSNSIPASPSQTVSTTTATISELTNGTTYYVWVKGKNTTGTGTASAVVNGKPIGNMGTVTLVSGNEQLTASWSMVGGADQYEVYYSTSNSIPGSSSQTVTTTTAKISGLTNGTTYYVWVKPKNANGTGTVSTAVSGKPMGIPEAPLVTPDYKQLFVTWTAVLGADEYEVYYGIGTPSILATTTTATTVTITGLTEGITYCVCLRAKNVNGVSAFGPSTNSVPDSIRSPGLYRGDNKIGSQNLTDSLTYISSNAVSGDDFYIVLGADEFISPKTLSYSGKTVGISLLGYDSERTITLNANGSMFAVNSGVTLTLDENITFIGRSANYNTLVYVNGGNLIMKDKAKIMENTNTSDSSSSSGGGVRVDNSGTFTMSGGEISNTSSRSGGGVRVGSSGTFTMSGGEISSNSSTTSFSGGGGVSVGSNGTFTMTGGEISGNTSSSSGGGVRVDSSGTFTMNDGKISGNTSSSGGGVYVNSSGTFTMNDGKISGNTSSSDGGGVYVSSGTFTMNDGKISGNTSSSDGGGVYVSSSGTFTKSGGGIITGYASDTVNGNVVKNSSGVVQSNRGHAVDVLSGLVNKLRETTAGPGVNLDSSKNGAEGGWEN
jgi:hypothetical protein